jgi:hypothetical protein
VQRREPGQEAEDPGTPRSQEFARYYFAFDLLSFVLLERQWFICKISQMEIS